ncbi:DUF4393 domain-containing protein [Pseudomonas syringae]|uniref:DUF4393 domain-containing protein n=1 Tax=Pseudomonas syringae TaxID=317 RepID=UPI001027A959|nr:DUF4393 domain-containing protein [Pseudomonas syringae]MCK9776169.1 DUF4393 domain-containing protein [Pseudomonas syringae pv. syringae]RXF66114.1 hypothetical protein BKM77_05195 [Pseudomonas syringae]
MGDEESGKDAGSSNINATIDAVTGLVKAVPVYQDVVQPAAKELGKSFQTVARAINVALIPLKSIIWSFEKIETLFIPKVEERLKDVPPEDIITPKANVAGPALEALRYVGDEESLSDMYANLLASAMDRKTAGNAHPAFVEIIKQLTPDEARLIAYFIGEVPLPLITVRSQNRHTHDGVDFAENVSLFAELVRVDVPNLVPSYLDNLARLGLIEILKTYAYTDSEFYRPLENSLIVLQEKVMIELDSDSRCVIKRGSVRITHFGQQFGDVCVTSKSKSRA